ARAFGSAARAAAGRARRSRSGVPRDRSRVVLLARLHGDAQPVRRRSERADPARLVRAGRVVGEVEVEHELAAVFPEIRTFHRVEQVAAAAVGLAPAGRVAEAEKEAAAVALEPVELQGQ